jgi:8-oxo-dGTP pyrophosphatase MutT (NUDIX family)
MLPKLRAENGREFTCFPAAVLVVVVNDLDEVLLFSKGESKWVVISGGVEGNETILGAALRELREEAGESVEVYQSVLHTRIRFTTTIPQGT